MALIGKKNKKTKQNQLGQWNKGSWELNPTWVKHNTEKTVMFNSSCTPLSF